MKYGKVDRRLAAELSGKEKIEALMTARHGSATAWAVARARRNPSEIHMTLRGDRPYPEIRALIAEDFDLSIEEVDQLIDEQRAELPAGAK